MAKIDFIISAFNLSQDQIDSFECVISGDVMQFNITLINSHPECPFCGGPSIVKDYYIHRYNHLDIAGHSSEIVWRRRRYKCKDCGKTFSEQNPFGPEHFHQSYAVLRQIAVDLKSTHKTFTDIANERHVSPTIVSLYADSFLHAPRLTLPVNLGIDEIHSDMAKYGGSYLCVFVDNDKRCLNDLLPNRSKSTLSRHLEKIPREERDRVRFVTIDLWKPYEDIANLYFKKAIVAADPFHVVKHLTDAFSGFRISIMNQTIKDSPAYYLLKHYNWLFIRTDLDLDGPAKYNGFFRRKMTLRELRDLLMDINPELTLAYRLMDRYRDFVREANEDDCAAQLDQLIEIFENANLNCYREFLNLLKTWKPEIINSFKRPDGIHKLSNALTENTNQRIRVLLHVSNGYANFERFRARALYCLNDNVFYSLTDSLYPRQRKGKKRGSYRKHFDNSDNNDNSEE